MTSIRLTDYNLIKIYLIPANKGGFKEVGEIIKKSMMAIMIIILLTFITIFRTDAQDITPQTKIANPASEHCIRSGGSLVIKKDKDGAEYGVCHFKDGRQCEEWAYFRGQCPINKGFKDPFDYCSNVKTTDTPDKRVIDRKSNKMIIDAMVRQGIVSRGTPLKFKKNFVWRCMNGQVFVCHFGANIPCLEKANTSKEPTKPMIDYCKTNPQSDFLPAYITGRDTIYEWRCKDGEAFVEKEILKTDERGYIADYWYLIQKR